MIYKLEKHGLLYLLTIELYLVCESSLKKKWSSYPLWDKGKGPLTYYPLYTFDVCGLFDELDKGGYLYFTTFTDDQL